jgi:hypothetical protein
MRSRGAAPRGEDRAGLDDDDDGEEDGAPLGFVPLAGRSPVGGDDGLDDLLDYEDGGEEEEEVRCGRACDGLGGSRRGRRPGLQAGVVVCVCVWWWVENRLGLWNRAVCANGPAKACDGP